VAAAPVTGVPRICGGIREARKIATMAATDDAGSTRLDRLGSRQAGTSLAPS
jgi:L-alanine-DL-glutamate epimerase-like enolase superfamily enzyme